MEVGSLKRNRWVKRLGRRRSSDDWRERRPNGAIGLPGLRASTRRERFEFHPTSLSVLTRRAGTNLAFWWAPSCRHATQGDIKAIGFCSADNVRSRPASALTTRAFLLLAKAAVHAARRFDAVTGGFTARLTRLKLGRDVAYQTHSKRRKELRESTSHT